MTDHGFFDCPDTEKVRKLFAYCKVCNKAGHDYSDCPKATEDVVKKLAYCMICRKNTDHNIARKKMDRLCTTEFFYPMFVIFVISLVMWVKNALLTLTMILSMISE
ncbi:hypothetical protein ACLB2K_005172 [Fragaria x ananassa]